jgi:hypothetical protein
VHFKELMAIFGVSEADPDQDLGQAVKSQRIKWGQDASTNQQEMHSRN